MSADDTIVEQIDIESGTLVGWLNPLTKPLRHKLGLVGLVFLALLPLGLRPITALTVAGAFYFAMFAMSWDVVSGYTGQISFGHSVFFTVGGYTSALLNIELGVQPLLAIPVGVVLATVAGLIIGVPTLRLRGPYFSLVTLIAPLILLRLAIVYSDVLGGTQGIGDPDKLLGLSSSDAVLTYYIAFGLFVVILAVLLAITRSDAGRVFTAIRESEDAVSSAGLNPAKFKIFAFLLSSAVGGLAGAMFVHSPVGNATPDPLLILDVNIGIIIASIIGGMGTIVGAAIGGLVFKLAQNVLEDVELVVPLLDVSIGEINVALFALLTIVLIYLLPGGLLRGAVLGGRSILSRTGRDVATDGGQPAANPVRQTIATYRESLGGDDDER